LRLGHFPGDRLQVKEVEAEINWRRGEVTRRSDIPLTNVRGIELRDLPAAIARLALIFAGYPYDVLYRGHQEALAKFLPLAAGPRRRSSGHL
jgi:hypothetical protein